VIQPVATSFARGELSPCCRVHLTLDSDQKRVAIEALENGKGLRARRLRTKPIAA